ncbi:16S/23S rRNA (cytidine-2'-O)-methyltransferase [Campylobacter pinnipediorum subsp. pinnipediorum]|uniref:23S rRNA (cytidine-2'-O)-methyltransferase TlyA n=1 Tax=Campylobacter pinnipediorum TaxID=1965231 RepID=UPI000995D1A4|nr:TlyA family RNA methyltransferase [Campylobacter pinnipediorum]AQW81517.1 16S/23S rRNA (cytidine-2'-O)-methyltransferase [Campylobacter pinnipediorum subsp. pinnipediorum]
MRADIFVATKLDISRNKASELIKNSKVMFDGEILSKPAFEIEDADIKLLDKIYVGRGALKLKSFLRYLNLDLKGKNALDIGSSTGGFMQILLENGIDKVVGIDVGKDQLDKSLRDDGRVEIYEETDIREFKNNDKFDIITCDVSFISILQILKDIDRFMYEGSTAVLLFKPQYEVGKSVKRNKKGVVVDKKSIGLVMKNFELECAKLGWILIETKECELKGKEGNAEFFYAFNKR